MSEAERLAREKRKAEVMNEAKALAEEHCGWFGKWIRRLEMPKDHREFVEIVEDAYKDGMVHGFKHGKEVE